MSITWLNAAAFWGLALVAVPIAIHLLVRQQTRTVMYPSLRFVRETALAAFRRRAIQDALLLACRIAVVAAAVMAMAGPLIHTAAREARYADRTSVAIVKLDDSVVDDTLAANAFRSQSFERRNVADALADATRWLDAQPPSSREIVVSGRFRKGQIAQSDLYNVPAAVGIRFVPVPAAIPDDRFDATTLTRRNGQPVFERRRVRLGADSTEISGVETSPAGADLVRIVAPPEHEALAAAALQAAMAAGLRWPNADPRVVVVWGSAVVPDTSADILRMPVPHPPHTAASAVWTLIEASTPQEAAEPLQIAEADLAAWSRPPQGIAPNAVPADEGDRRWFWAMALAFLGVEHLLRRRTRTAATAAPESRVA